MSRIRPAIPADASRIAEIIITNYRTNFYPFFRNDAYYFGELNVMDMAAEYADGTDALRETFVYDDGVVKGIIRSAGDEIVKLFIEPTFQSQGIGAKLLHFAVSEKNASWLWVLEYNTRGIDFYKREGFSLTGERILEDAWVPLLKMTNRPAIPFTSTRNTRPILPDSLRFIRSDVPAAVTETERQWLLAHDVTTLVDLRTPAERAQKPCPLADDPAFCCHCLPVTGGNAVPAAPDCVADSYIAMADASMDEIIDTILKASSNVLYFCNAGKDRTGVVSAILLHRAGYDAAFIEEDYLRSGVLLADALQAFAAQHPEIDPEVITPRAAYIRHFLEWLQQQDDQHTTNN